MSRYERYSKKFMPAQAGMNKKPEKHLNADVRWYEVKKEKVDLLTITKKLGLFSTWLMLFFLTHPAFAHDDNKFSCPFYAGISGGYGWTTWQGLVPPEDKQNFAMSTSTPTYVNEGGGLWGLFAGYEILPSGALEIAYMRYPNAKVSFDRTSLFSFEHNGRTDFITRTEQISLMAKIMLIIPTTDFRIYSSLGAAEVHRSDEVNDHWIVTPTFGTGINYNFTQHIMLELGSSFTVGRGESELSPAEDYFPFLYAVFLRLAYRF